MRFVSAQDMNTSGSLDTLLEPPLIDAACSQSICGQSCRLADRMQRDELHELIHQPIDDAFNRLIWHLPDSRSSDAQV